MSLYRIEASDDVADEYDERTDIETKMAIPTWVKLIQYETPTSQSVMMCCRHTRISTHYHD